MRKRRILLGNLWELFQREHADAVKCLRSQDEEDPGGSGESVPHRMIKLLMLLAHSPTEPRKRSDVIFFPDADAYTDGPKPGSGANRKGSKERKERKERKGSKGSNSNSRLSIGK